MGPEHNANFGNLYTYFIAQLVAILPPGTDLQAAYAGGSDEEQAFVQNLAMFLTSYFRVRPNSACGVLLPTTILPRLPYPLFQTFPKSRPRPVTSMQTYPKSFCQPQVFMCLNADMLSFPGVVSRFNAVALTKGRILGPLSG